MSEFEFCQAAKIRVASLIGEIFGVKSISRTGPLSTNKQVRTCEHFVVPCVRSAKSGVPLYRST